KVEDILNEYVLTEETMEKIKLTIEEQMKFANSKDEETRKKSDLFWECTYVTGLMSGKENGQYLGLDLGGTNFRVVGTVFTNGKADIKTKYYNLPTELFTGPCSGIFDHIAESIEKFIKEENISSDTSIPIGFSFSFPSIQKSLKHSVLVTWTKSFKCPDGLGQDPVVMLEEAIHRRGGLSVPVDVIARISDTTGTLMAGNYLDHNCRIGLILGSGSNACFVEKVEKYNKLETDIGSDKVVVNTEWGALGDNGCLDFIKTELDKELDLNSNHVHSFSFEKLFSGLYLGELVRLVLLKLTKDGCLFDGQTTDNLQKPYFFTTDFVSDIESERIVRVLEKLELDTVATADDIAIIRKTCAILSQRGAYVVAIALAVLLKHMNLPEVTIGIDGSLYEFHPKYHDHILDVLTKLVKDTKVTNAYYA
ncbi:hypothetical protein FSP39_002233, partial [Pinctada imbricata]